ncbi:hypothetical protein EPA93_16110 [Ktedonosporobacter rubrisoli]|uniref:Uncharacterized protein n=1 Tax=Ktedonosporobacter rubrisoli TaxID=2509675 RepID=A0A4P6JQA4_KTERU|nr:hypothetical protein EPA93_16110 [Ktedonosporobacter rubrisoli]
MRVKIKKLSVFRNIVSILPLVFIFTILLLYLTFPAKTYSKEERRYLEQWPTFHVGRVLDGSYETKMESYFSDQFPFRSFWIHVSTELQAWLGHRSAETTQHHARITPRLQGISLETCEPSRY